MPADPALIFHNTSSNTFNTSLSRVFFEHCLFDVVLDFANLKGDDPKPIPPDSVLVNSLLEQTTLKPVQFSLSFIHSHLIRSHPSKLRSNCLKDWPQAINNLFHPSHPRDDQASKSSRSSPPPPTPYVPPSRLLESSSRTAEPLSPPPLQSKPSNQLVLSQSCLNEFKRLSLAHSRDQKMLRPVVINNLEIAATAISFLLDVSDFPNGIATPD